MKPLPAVPLKPPLLEWVIAVEKISKWVHEALSFALLSEVTYDPSG